MPFLFEKLAVYQRSLDLADRVIGATSGAPRGLGFLCDQLRRAALSLPANIAEGNGRFALGDRRHFFVIARGSVQECVPLLELARRHGVIETSEHDRFATELEEVSRMLSGLITGTDRRHT